MGLGCPKAWERGYMGLGCPKAWEEVLLASPETSCPDGRNSKALTTLLRGNSF